MADQEPDGVVEQAAERLTGQVTVLLTVAGRAGEEYARHRRRTLEQAARDTEQSAAQLRARFNGERAAARAQLAATSDAGWWATASPQQVADAWQTAVSWRDADERIAADTPRLVEEIYRRYGVDPDQLPSTPEPSGAVPPGAARGPERDDAALAAALVTGEAETAAVLVAPEQGDWDTIAARAQRADAARASGAEAQAIQARVIADLSQATPPARAASDQAAASVAQPRRPAQSTRSQRITDRAR